GRDEHRVVRQRVPIDARTRENPMNQWRTSVVAKFLGCGKKTAAAQPQRRACLGLESLSGGSSLDSSRRLPVAPHGEHLEARCLMSSLGVISAVTDNAGRTVVFTIGSDQQVWELNPAVSSRWFRLADYNTAGFRQVSAGLDGYGRAVCYAIHNGDSRVWEM